MYRRFSGPLFGTAVGLLRDRSAAADVVHDTFLRAAGRITTLREPDRLRAWMFAILRNEAVSVHRARRHVAGSLDDLHDGWESAVTAHAGAFTDPRPAADVTVSQQELTALVWAAADGLQHRDREVLELHVRGGLEASDLGDVLGVGPSHAAVLLSRMRDGTAVVLGTRDSGTETQPLLAVPLPDANDGDGTSPSSGAGPTAAGPTAAGDGGSAAASAPASAGAPARAARGSATVQAGAPTVPGFSVSPAGPTLPPATELTTAPGTTATTTPPVTTARRRP